MSDRRRFNLMASETKVTPQSAEMLEEEDPGIPRLDLSDSAGSAGESLFHSATMDGYVAEDQIGLLRSSEDTKPERAEDVLAKFDEMDVRLVEADAAFEVEVLAGEESKGETGGENDLVEFQRPSALVQSKTKEAVDRTDDPVRMYLRDMSSIELLSREGEVAIAKR